MRMDYIEIPPTLLGEEEFVLQLPVDHPEQGEALGRLMRISHENLRQEREFGEWLHEARGFIPTLKQPVHSRVVSEDAYHRLTLISLHSRSRIPVHDHPGVVSIQMVLDGSLRIRHFENKDGSGDGSVVRLKCNSDKILGAGEISITGRDKNNLHSLDAISSTAICLSLQLPPCPTSEQYWYFPVNPNESYEQASFWIRIRNRTRQ